MLKNDFGIPNKRGGRRLGAGRKKKKSPIKRSARNNRDRDSWHRDRLKLATIDAKIQNFAENDQLSAEYKSLITERESLHLKLVIRNRNSGTVGEESSDNFPDEILAVSSDSDEDHEVLNSEFHFFRIYILVRKYYKHNFIFKRYL
jgi:hypothetical protein